MQLDDPFRSALAEVEAQRDDGLAYLGALRGILEMLEQTQGIRPCAHAIARTLVRELGVESCAVVLREGGALAIVGYASQGDRFGEGGEGFTAEELLALAHAVLAADASVQLPDRLRGDGVDVLPLHIRGVLEGALVLHTVVAPGQQLARRQAVALVADAVAHALGVARAQASLASACRRLQREVGDGRATLAARDGQLREHEVRLGECEHELARLTDDLGRANRVKQEFLGIVSHELRTPLNAVIGFGQLLRDDLADGRHQEQLEMVDAVLSGGMRLGSLVDDMLFFVEVCSSRFVPRHVDLDLRQLVEATLAQIEEPVRAAASAIHVDVSPAVERVRLDRSLTSKALFHALDNACKFADGGDVRVRAQLARDGVLALEVADEGIGMEAHEVARVFQPFAQRDGSLKRRHPGLGLGLALVRRVSEILGGSVTLDSRPGSGTTLRLTVPLPAGEVDPQSAGRAA